MRSQVLKVDVDQGHRPLSLKQLVVRLARANRRLVAVGQWRSPSGTGWHRVILVRPAPRSAMEVVALQLLLGSDPYREAYNLNRARQVDAGAVPRRWRRQWNVLYGR